jgi:hypothetical protein
MAGGQPAHTATAGGSGGGSTEAGAADGAAVSLSCACIGSLCLRHCVTARQ